MSDVQYRLVITPNKFGSGWFAYLRDTQGREYDMSLRWTVWGARRWAKRAARRAEKARRVYEVKP